MNYIYTQFNSKIKFFFLTLLLAFASSSILTQDITLSEYSYEVYNALPTVEEANQKLAQRKNFEEFLKESFKIIEKHNLPLGFRLIHKHFPVDKNQGMVEYFIERFEPFSNRPALITSPAYVDSETYPASWILKGETLTVFEFSKDNEVKLAIDQIKTNIEAFSEVVRTISRYGLSDLLAVSVTSRSVVGYFPEPHMLENQFSFGSAVIGISDLNTDTLGIKTSWGPKKVWCMPDSYCHWDNDRQQHFIIVTGHDKVPGR